MLIRQDQKFVNVEIGYHAVRSEPSQAMVEGASLRVLVFSDWNAVRERPIDHHGILGQRAIQLPAIVKPFQSTLMVFHAQTTQVRT